MSDDLSLCSLYLIGSALLVVIGLPLQQGWVPPNRWYGFCTPLTLGNADLWYAVNRVTGFWLMATGIATVGTATITHLGKVDALVSAFLNGGTYLIGLLIMTIASLIRQKQQ